MEPPHSDAAYASSLQTLMEPTWKVRLCNSNRLKLKLPRTNLSWGPKGGSVVNEISRHPVLEHQAGKCKFLQTCTLAVKGA